MVPDQVIRTERLILRAHQVDDYSDVYAMWSDPIVTKYIGGVILSREDAWARLLRYAGNWSFFGYGLWAVRDIASGEFVGDVGFQNLNRDISPPFGDRPELGYVLTPKAHGRGIATEAARAVLKWADLAWGERETVCMIAPENTPSIRIAIKLGYSETARSEHKGTPMILFARRGVRSLSA